MVTTPRPERKLRKSSVGPLIEPLRPPAHSIWATFLPPRSAAWASVSACRMLGFENAAVETVKALPLMWNVLFVEPWTPGQAPVVSENQPAPVFGGACVSRPWSDACAPSLSSSLKPGSAFPYLSTACKDISAL